MSAKRFHAKQNLKDYLQGLIKKKYTLKQVSDFTGYSVVHLCNLKKRFILEGDSVFQNGHKGIKPKNAIPQETKEQIIKIYKSDFQGFNFLFFTKALKEFYNLNYSYKTIYSILDSQGITSPETHKKPKKGKAHRPRYRREQAGDLLQIDATPYQWFKYSNDTSYYALHGAIDDATGKITALYLSENECSHGYYEILEQTFSNYGMPHEIYSDRSAIFCVTPKEKNKLTIQEQLEGLHEKRTQWQKILSHFSIKQILAWSPQAKGRVERMWKTLQGRLPWYFKHYKIKTIKEANKFLKDKFINIFNREFSINAEAPKIWRTPPINFTEHICSKFTRKTNAVGVISFQGCLFQVEAPIKTKTEITFCIFKDSFKAFFNNKFYNVTPLNTPNKNMTEALKDIINQYLYSDAKTISA